MENAKQVIKDIHDNLSQRSASHKDEIAVMKAIMNDRNYSVDVYDKTGKTGEYCPGKEFRKVVANTVSSITHIPVKEAEDLVNKHEFTKADASSMVDLSKEFINSYLQTGRKLSLGGRVNSDINLIWKDIAERTTEVPVNIGGERTSTVIPVHGGIKVSNPCPKWVK